MIKPKSRYIFFYIDPVAYQAFKLETVRANQPMGAILRKLIQQWLKKRHARPRQQEAMR